MPPVAVYLVQAFSSNTVDHVNDAIRTSYIGSHQLGAVDGYAVVAIDMNRRAASIGQARLLTPLLIAGRRPVLTSIQVVIATCYRPVIPPDIALFCHLLRSRFSHRSAP